MVYYKLITLLTVIITSNSINSKKSNDKDSKNKTSNNKDSNNKDLKSKDTDKKDAKDDVINNKEPDKSKPIDDDFSEFDELMDEKYELFTDKRIKNLTDIIPISICVYKEAFNFNLATTPKSEVDNVYKKNIFTLFNMSKTSYDVLYKLKKVHNKIWNKAINKHPNNKAMRYILTHFEPSVGLFFENNFHDNYYNYKIIDSSNPSNKKNITTVVGAKILRIGPAFKFKWLITESGLMNASLMFSFGWQTNIYAHGCSHFHYKDTWVVSKTNYDGFDDKGYSEYYVREKLNLKHVYVMFQVDFSYYFGKIYFRFYSPISKGNVSHKLFDDKRTKGFNFQNMKEAQLNDTNSVKKLVLDKWTMAIGLSLAI